MSYFKETFESILETKSQALAHNERRITDARQSNEWHRNNPGPGRGVRREYGPSYSGRPGTKSLERKKEEAEKAMRPMRTAEDYRRREKLFGANAKAADKSDKSTAKYRDFVGKHPTAQKVVRKIEGKHESFDPVYEDLCRMGIID